MRNLCVVVLVLALSGCGVELVATTAIEGAAQAENAKILLNQKDAAVGQLDRVKIERAVETYRAQTGALPAQLEDLVPDYLPILPVKSDGFPYGYDPVTGRISG